MLSLIIYKCATTETSLSTLDGYEKIETVKNTSTSNLRKHVLASVCHLLHDNHDSFLAFLYIFIYLLYEICSEVGKEKKPLSL